MKKEIKQFVAKFAGFFGLTQFIIQINYPETNKESLLADIDTDVAYQRIIINIYPRFFKESKSEQRKTLIHELCHTLLNDLEICAWELKRDKVVTKSHIENIVEATTSKLENMFDYLLSDGKIYRKAYKDYI